MPLCNCRRFESQWYNHCIWCRGNEFI